MRKVFVLLALLASSQVFWQPMRGDAPRVRKETGTDKKGDPAFTAGNPAPSQPGTKTVPFVVDTKGHQNSPEETAKDKREEDHKAFVDRWTVGATVAVAAFTGILMIIGALGVWAANRTLKAIEKQADLQERAIRPWVGTARISDGSLAPDGPDRMAVSTSVILKNTGPSVALRGLMLPFLISNRMPYLPSEIQRCWRQTEEMLKAKNQIEWETGFVLHPGATHTHKVFMGTDAPLAGIRAGLCWVLVCIVYWDQFGKEHRTQDCFETGGIDGAELAMRFKAIPAHQTAN